MVLHGHVAVRAAVSERAPLLLEGDEVPYGHHGVVRHIEVKQFHAGERVERIQFPRRSGEVFGHKKAICGERKKKSMCHHVSHVHHLSCVESFIVTMLTHNC